MTTPKIVQLTVIQIPARLGTPQPPPVLLGLDAEGKIWQPQIAEIGGRVPRINWEEVTQTFFAGRST